MEKLTEKGLDETTKILQRLWSKSIKTSNNCWDFFGGTSNGYGCIQFRGKTHKVHRVSASIFLGYQLDDKDHIVCHKSECITTRCWNPEHLYIGTVATNAQDRERKVRTK